MLLSCDMCNEKNDGGEAAAELPCYADVGLQLSWQNHLPACAK